MHPILLKIGFVTIYTYGFFVAVAFFMALRFIKKEAIRLGENPEKIMDLSFYVLIAGVLGARIVYIFTVPHAFLSNPLEIFKIWNGGLVFYGGFIGAFCTLLFFVKKNKVSLLKYLDIYAPAIALGHFFGRLGCFSAGCCYGRQCDYFWSVVFLNPDSLAPNGVALHPTQLYSAFANILIFIFLYFFRYRKRFNGQVFFLYVFIYGIIRSVIETFRGDYRGYIIFKSFSLSQTLGIGFSICALIMLIILSRKKKTDI